jgi:hypothetical protein
MIFLPPKSDDLPRADEMAAAVASETVGRAAGSMMD